MYTSSGDTQEGNYNANSSKYGDAVYETSNHYSSTNGSWYEDNSKYPYSTGPFFHRGGEYLFKTGAGIFFFLSYSGSGYSYYGFRPVLVAL